MCDESAAQAFFEFGNDLPPGYSRVTGNWNGYKWIRKAKREAIYARDNWRCLYCNKDLRRVRKGERGLDHLRPRSLGGTNDAANLITCCKWCNDSRAATPWRKYACPDARARIRAAIKKPINYGYRTPQKGRLSYAMV